MTSAVGVRPYQQSIEHIERKNLKRPTSSEMYLHIIICLKFDLT